MVRLERPEHEIYCGMIEKGSLLPFFDDLLTTMSAPFAPATEPKIDRDLAAFGSRDADVLDRRLHRKRLWHDGLNRYAYGKNAK